MNREPIYERVSVGTAKRRHVKATDGRLLCEVGKYAERPHPVLRDAPPGPNECPRCHARLRILSRES